VAPGKPGSDRKKRAGYLLSGRSITGIDGAGGLVPWRREG